MSHSYRAVGWNGFKRRYDAVLAAAIVGYLTVFMAVSFAVEPSATEEIMLLRGTGTAAIVLLHVILCIGPLARLSPRFLPLLYNRRHLGVATFLVALLHGALATLTYHFGSDVNVFVSILVTDAGATRGSFPFQAFGFAALLILFVMAATSHDFWLRNLTAPVWKALHMSVYVAYALLLVHVSFGVLQSELHPGNVAALAVGFATVTALHGFAGAREVRRDAVVPADAGDGFVRVCDVADIPDGRAKIALVGGERVAVFRYGGLVSAVSNACQHQNGPLGEGRIVDGCITCPWHGYQYDPASGAAPAPFTEKLPTFAVRVVGGVVHVHRTPHPAGTRVEPARIEPPDTSGVEGGR
ncbi:MAG: ferric reductase-like transmembrane domain-containing protein [Planctomycetes bacterium]|nr:ferric reductase-like transmembrane domain-containing protein [Planctomycetota bacterium]